jgi:hypothetical protein
VYKAKNIRNHQTLSRQFVYDNEKNTHTHTYKCECVNYFFLRLEPLRGAKRQQSGPGRNKSIIWQLQDSLVNLNEFQARDIVSK